MTVKIDGTNTAASPAFTGADTDTGLQCGTNELNLVTGGTARATVDSSGNVGIGATSPTEKLTVTGGNIQVDSSSRKIGFKLSGNSNAGYLIPYNSGGNTELVNERSGSSLIFKTANAEQVRIDGSGRLNIGATSNSYTGAGLQVNNSVGSFFVTDNSHLLLQNKNSSTTNWWNIAPRDDGTLTVGNGAPGSTGIVTDRKLTIRNDGVVLIGKTSPSYHTAGIELDPDDWITVTNNGLGLRLNRTGTDGEVAQFMNDGSIVGRIQVSGSSTSYNTSSDYRLKENVVDLDGAIDRVKQLAPKRFNFINDADTTLDGFLAHEAQTVVPEAVTGTHNEVDDDGNAVMQGIDQSKLVPLLTAALQEAIAKIETLETKVAALEATE